MNSAPKILVIDDNPDDRELVRRLIQRELPDGVLFALVQELVGGAAEA